MTLAAASFPTRSQESLPKMQGQTAYMRVQRRASAVDGPEVEGGVRRSDGRWLAICRLLLNLRQILLARRCDRVSGLGLTPSNWWLRFQLSAHHKGRLGKLGVVPCPQLKPGKSVVLICDDAVATIVTDGAPVPAGHYAQATVHQGLVYVSGQLPVTRDGAHDPAASFEDQTRRAIANLLAIVAEAGSSRERILKVTAYIAGVEHWPSFNSVYASIFGQARPARTVVPVPGLHYGYLIELDAIAAVAPK